MESAEADAHYTERLVRLPNLSIHYEPLAVEEVTLDRSELGLRPAATVFWSGQTLTKYLPQYDQVFPRIARELEDCQPLPADDPRDACRRCAYPPAGRQPLPIFDESVKSTIQYFRKVT